MDYQRVISRNGLHGDYRLDGQGKERTGFPHPCQGNISQGLVAGDLRRLERDMREPEQLTWFASATGLTPLQCKNVLDCLFNGFPDGTWTNLDTYKKPCETCQQTGFVPDNEGHPDGHICSKCFGAKLRYPTLEELEQDDLRRLITRTR